MSASNTSGGAEVEDVVEDGDVVAAAKPSSNPADVVVADDKRSGDIVGSASDRRDSGKASDRGSGQRQAAGKATGQESDLGSAGRDPGEGDGQPSQLKQDLLEDDPAERQIREYYQIYERDQERWARLLSGVDESLVMQLRPLSMRYHFDPLTWKFRTEPEHAWTVPTGNRTPNREALKVLRKEMEASGELPPRRRHHHHHHHRDDDATKKKKTKKRTNKGIKNSDNVASPMQMALQARGEHVSWISAPTRKTSLGEPSGSEGGKREKIDKKLRTKKQSARSHDIELTSSVAESMGIPQPPPLTILEVTFFSVTVHWYDLTAVGDENEEDVQEIEEVKENKEEQIEGDESDAQEKMAEETPADVVEEKTETGGNGIPLSKPSIKTDEQKNDAVQTITLAAAKKRESLEAKLHGDSRLIFILESKENHDTREWKPISVGYGRHYVHDMLQSRTKYAYRVRAMDRERGIFSPFSDVLEVTTKRPPHTLQDLLIKITTNDMKGMVEILETGEVNPNAEDSMGFSPLMRAAQQDKTKTMQALLRNGALVDFQSKEQRRTALMVAAYSGNLQAVKCLLLFEASYELYDSSRLTAVHWAVDSGNMELMEYMLADGANIECFDNQGWTPLHRTALVGARTEGVCEVLLRYGAKIDRVDKDMKTPLMNATISNKGQITQILISRGADVYLQNKDGRTAYDLACALERKGTMMLLEDLARSQNREIAALHGGGLKGGTTRMEGAEFENLDSFARQLAQKMRKKPSIDPLAQANSNRPNARL